MNPRDIDQLAKEIVLTTKAMLDATEKLILLRQENAALKQQLAEAQKRNEELSVENAELNRRQQFTAKEVGEALGIDELRSQLARSYRERDDSINKLAAEIAQLREALRAAWHTLEHWEEEDFGDQARTKALVEKVLGVEGAADAAKGTPEAQRVAELEQDKARLIKILDSIHNAVRLAPARHACVSVPLVVMADARFEQMVIEDAARGVLPAGEGK